MAQSKTQEPTAVVANLVAEGDRLSFLPTFFGQHLMMRGETLVFNWLDRLSEDYNGGYWHFYRLSNGGFYLAPDSDKSMRISVEGNGFDGEMSADAAGIVATFFALSQLTGAVQGTEAGDTLIDRYFFLSDFAAEHVEAGLIFRAID